MILLCFTSIEGDCNALPCGPVGPILLWELLRGSVTSAVHRRMCHQLSPDYFESEENLKREDSRRGCGVLDLVFKKKSGLMDVYSQWISQVKSATESVGLKNMCCKSVLRFDFRKVYGFSYPHYYFFLY